MREKLPERYKELVDILQNMMSFNPFFRMTALESLQCKVFDPVRDPKREKIIKELNKQKLSKKYQIELPVDADDAFDYENSSNAKYTVDDLKSILAREIKEIKHEI